ncbi:MAG TPA: hypothetical protein VMT94_01135 [Burkholderiales bacterium]|nr:hypothetical protein [Burkholderiales bacterium]
MTTQFVKHISLALLIAGTMIAPPTLAAGSAAGSGARISNGNAGDVTITNGNAGNVTITNGNAGNATITNNVGGALNGGTAADKHPNGDGAYYYRRRHDKNDDDRDRAR